MEKILLTGGDVYYQGEIKKLDILIEGDEIKEIKPHVSSPINNLRTIEMTGKVICPGFLDIHCHIRTPGQEYKEDIKTASLAAVRGGFTDIMAMANTNPVVDNIQIIKELKTKIEEESLCNIHIVGAVTKGLKGEELVDFEEISKEVVAFSDDGKGVQKSEIMEEAFKQCKSLGKKIISHCEYEMEELGSINEGKYSELLDVKGINNETEWEMVDREICLASMGNTEVHIAHVSTKESVEIIRKAKEKGIRVTAEACPHHYLLTDKETLRLGSIAKVNPPLRSEEDRLAVLEGLREGLIDCIATDHAPHSEAEKEQPLDKAPFGMVGLETAVPLTLDLVNKGQFSLKRLIESLGVTPYQIFNIPGGALGEGQRANLTILDLNADFTIDKNKFYSKGKNTPFHGFTGKGDVYMTIIGGKIKYQREDFNVCK